ncbi:MAG: SRPBCC domain-containing protein [Chthonomonas sp.]|nr:SRPBCC domain-containing protein [Chthonomonas sp.]
MTTKHQLKVELPSPTEIRMTRSFDAPRDLVYRVFADHTTHQHWMGCGYGKVLESTGKPEIGEPWHFRMDMGEHGQMHLFGQCLEAIPNERLVRTFIYDVPQIRECASVEICTFSESNGVTTIEVLVQHLSQENRDGHVNSGMEQGAGSSYDALDRYLAEVDK